MCAWGGWVLTWERRTQWHLPIQCPNRRRWCVRRGRGPIFLHKCEQHFELDPQVIAMKWEKQRESWAQSVQEQGCEDGAPASAPESTPERHGGKGNQSKQNKNKKKKKKVPVWCKQT